MTDFSFLSPLPTIQPPQNIPLQPPQNIPLQSPPSKFTSSAPPLIILDDYSVDDMPQNSTTQEFSEPPSPVGSPSTGILSIHHHGYSTSGNSDSDSFYPPSSAVPSETSSAVVSESDLPSAVASESDLPPQPKNRLSMSKTQTGIHSFFRVLTADEAKAARAKRKWTNSEEEEADRAKRRQKEENQREKKLAVRRKQNTISQQKSRKKALVAEIQAGKRDIDGKLIKVS